MRRGRRRGSASSGMRCAPASPATRRTSPRGSTRKSSPIGPTRPTTVPTARKTGSSASRCTAARAGGRAISGAGAWWPSRNCRRGCASQGGLMENRRRFLQASAAAVTARSVLGANDRVQMAIIGTGTRGNQVFTGFSAHTDQVFVAACDVAADRLDAFVTKNGKMDTYKDYRRVLERKDIDAVLITAPDHQHEPILQAALSAGKDAYIEKPISNSRWSINQNYVYRDVNSTPNDTSDDRFLLVFQNNVYELLYSSQDNQWHTEVDYHYRIQNLTTTANNDSLYWVL